MRLQSELLIFIVIALLMTIYQLFVNIMCFTRYSKMSSAMVQLLILDFFQEVTILQLLELLVALKPPSQPVSSDSDHLQNDSQDILEHGESSSSASFVTKNNTLQTLKFVLFILVFQQIHHIQKKTMFPQLKIYQL